MEHIDHLYLDCNFLRFELTRFQCPFINVHNNKSQNYLRFKPSNLSEEAQGNLPYQNNSRFRCFPKSITDLDYFLFNIKFSVKILAFIYFIYKKRPAAPSSFSRHISSHQSHVQEQRSSVCQLKQLSYLLRYKCKAYIIYYISQ